MILLTDEGAESSKARELLRENNIDFEEWPASMFINIQNVPYLLSSLTECGGLEDIKSCVGDLAKMYSVKNSRRKK